MALRKLRHERLFTTLASAADSHNSSHPPPVPKEVDNRIRTLCSRYSPCRTSFQLQFNDYIKLKNRIKTSRYFALLGGYVFGCFTFASNSMWFFPWLMSDSPLTIMGMEGIDPMIIGTCMTFASGITCVIITAFGYRNFHLRVMGSETKANFYQREEDFQRRLNLYRCTDSVEVGFSDDYYGDKIKDLTDYRYWVRVQQIKHENSQRAKEAAQKSDEG